MKKGIYLGTDKSKDLKFVNNLKDSVENVLTISKVGKGMGFYIK